MTIVANLIALFVILTVAHRTASIAAVVILALAFAAIGAYVFGIYLVNLGTLVIGSLYAYLRRPVLFKLENGERPWGE